MAAGDRRSYGGDTAMNPSGVLQPMHPRHLRRLLPLSASLLLLTGCFPHRQQIVPAIDGMLVRGQVPVAGARIHVLPSMFKAGCGPSRHTAVTDATGRFTIRGASEIGVMLPMGDRINTWGVCIEHDGRWVEGFKESDIGWPPRRIDMDCDLARVRDVCEWKARDR
ncbi:carboxypeptidase-like regulatory domain-containing protein [Pseudoxanthomonas sp. z9]|uniref:carboxypeptidase-like regulatory domain-containing protein n=1 Tax=Pseudoxanthomonas sp. z9 TaxID=2584942 RepID=UPI00114459A7|nr:carboxypeptidase-like regulatory domain-containing protein [Pseudoxanthomonas sp. z9]